MNVQISLIDADLSSVRPEKVEEIKSSIAAIGVLLHPITVRQNGQRYDLIAGRVRLKTFIELGRTEIPATIEEGIIATNLEVAIHENLKRYNLPWHEQVDLEAQLHEMRQEQHGRRKLGRGATQRGGWSQEDTAKELGIALGAMSQDLFLANAIRRNPNLMKVQDKMTALKLAKEAAKREHIEAETLIATDFELNQILCGDASIVLKEVPDETFNVCITDPPWSQYTDPKFVSDDRTFPVFKEVFRVLKRDSILYAVLSTTDFYTYRRELPKFGFIVQEYPLIWYKRGTISHGKRAWEYGRDYETILVAAKVSPVLTTSTQLSAILDFSPVRGTLLTHPNEKPVKLLEKLIGDSTFDEGRVLDPFAGSGATLVAAKRMRRHYLGIERDFHFYEKIVKRLAKEDDKLNKDSKKNGEDKECPTNQSTSQDTDQALQDSLLLEKLLEETRNESGGPSSDNLGK